jgi:hypothetical protein
LIFRIAEENEVQILVDEDWDENMLNYQASQRIQSRVIEIFHNRVLEKTCTTVHDLQN